MIDIWRPARGRLGLSLQTHGHLIVAVMGAALFVVLQPPVPDLQAADARAAAAGQGVGLGYWLSWFGGTPPGGYSILTAALSAVVGVSVVAAGAAVTIGVLARPVLRGTGRPRSTAYLIVAASQCDLWSGRVAFGLGSAVALAGVVALRRDRAILGGLLNAVTALVSPVASAFVLLALIGPLITQRTGRAKLVVFAVLSAAGLVVPAAAFGVPGAMPFDAPTFAWTLVVPIALMLLARQIPDHLRYTIYAAILVVVVVFVVPNGLGANIQRYTLLILPPMAWALSHARPLITATVLLPAALFSGYTTVSDVAAGVAPSAQASYYRPLDTNLQAQPLMLNHRAEVIDTPTHGAAAALAMDVYLARGWESQTDTADNPIFYRPGPLTAVTYRNWLDANAVAYVAVPSRPDGQYATEVALVDRHPPYLVEVWHTKNWRLYAVARPQPIVALPGHLIQAAEGSLTFSMPAAARLILRIRPSKYLQISRPGSHGRPPCLVRETATTTSVLIPASGVYRLTPTVAAAILDPDRCH